MKKHGRMFICEECTVVFQVHSTIRNARIYCPKCGDNLDTVPYKAERTKKLGSGEKLVKPPWTDEELELVKKCLNGELSPHQVAIQLGRSVNAVVKKKSRMEAAGA